MKISVLCILAITLFAGFTLAQRHEAEEHGEEAGYEGTGPMAQLLQELREVMGLGGRKPHSSEEEAAASEAEAGEKPGTQGFAGLRRQLLALRREVAQLRRMVERSRHESYEQYPNSYALE
ncbi:unnamed protein product [Schistocephalus solidus]|uniref:Myosuppressin n=1 Tax=Schistocephalus solidus TaxID=70667 RepID=A0A183SB02_SCHSO|nr:unnamed protein product [Schistocephalus solidus]